jgi:chaperonin GroEL (HSP60 family)
VTSGANPVSIKKGIDKTVAGLIEELEKLARPVKGGDDIKGIVIITIRTFFFVFLVVSMLF